MLGFVQKPSSLLFQNFGLMATNVLTLPMLRLEMRESAKIALVVGPDSQLASELAEILPGWQIARTANNLSALKLVKAQRFDLVLTGENTSGSADIELLRRIRRIRPHLRLVILTNESTTLDVIASMREGAFSYFSKPFSAEAFREMIRLAAASPCWDDGVEVVSATPEWIQLFVRCDRGTADRLLQFFREFVDIPQPESDNIATAFREMLLNAIEHGGHFDPTQFVEISYLRSRHAVICRVKDPGQGFSLDEIQHAAVSNPPDDPLKHQAYRDAAGLRPGGFGLLMTESLVDELIYGERGNDVLLIKYVNVPMPTLSGQ